MQTGAYSSSREQNFVIFLGDNFTGKTSIIRRYIKNVYDEFYQTTLGKFLIDIGIDFFCKEIMISQSTDKSISKFNLFSKNFNKSLILKIWDAPGSEKEESILLNQFFLNACCFIICCSYDSLESLKNVKNWLQYIKLRICGKNETDTNLIVICNKFDLPDPLKKFSNNEIYKESLEILKVSNKFKIKIYHQVSAKYGLNIEYLFHKIIYLTSGFLINAISNKNRNSKLYFKKDSAQKNNNNRFELNKQIYDNIKLKRHQSRFKCCK